MSFLSPYTGLYMIHVAGCTMSRSECIWEQSDVLSVTLYRPVHDSCGRLHHEQFNLIEDIIHGKGRVAFSYSF